MISSLKKIDKEMLVQLCAVLVIVAAFLLALPSLWIPLGLPPEGDAVDYRIPLVRWILRHGEFPNWPWSMVDDYPSLGELLMVPLYGIHPSLARFVPILGYLGFAAALGAVGAALGRGQLKARTLFLVGAAWALCLRPAAIQSNLLMVDTLASGFLVASLAAIFWERALWAGFFAACAMATRYTTWGSAAFLPILLFILSTPALRWRRVFQFCLVAALGALPFMVRNFLLNDGHPFFPVDAPEIFGPMGVNGYGRGNDWVSLLRLPFDILYTNTVVKGFYDYTVGKFFYLQLIVWAGVLLWTRKVRAPRRLEWLALAFVLVHTLIWFYSGQQMRFLVPALAVLHLFFLWPLVRFTYVLAGLTLVGGLSVVSIQKPSLLMVLKGEEHFFSAEQRRAANCFERAGVGQDPVAYVARDNMLGYFDSDFYFLPPHPYATPIANGLRPPWIYSQKPRQGYEPWPPEEPCILKAKG